MPTMGTALRPESDHRKTKGMPRQKVVKDDHKTFFFLLSLIHTKGGRIVMPSSLGKLFIFPTDL